MPPKRRYRSYLEPGSSSTKVPRQTLWSQRRREASAADRASQSSGGGESHEDAATNSGGIEGVTSLHPDSGVPGSQIPELLQGAGSSDQQTPHGVPDAVQREEAPDPDEDVLQFIRVNSEVTLPNQTTTRLQAMLLVLAFVVAAGISWTQVDGLLKLLNAILGKEVFPSTKYGFRKLWNLQQAKVLEVHGYCPSCHLLTRSCGVGLHRCAICARAVTMAELIQKGSFFITMDLKYQLLQLLKSTGDLVGRNLRNLAASTHEGLYRDITDGELYRKTRSENNMTWSDLTLTLNSDGSPVFKSSKGSVWPIQVSLNELPVPHRWRNILVAAVWFAKEHPPAHLYLKTFVDKFNAIGKLTWSFAGQVVQSAVSIITCCVDSPARAALLNSKQFNGYYGCSWCLQKGALIDGEVTEYEFVNVS